jgi:hypothetical protein
MKSRTGQLLPLVVFFCFRLAPGTLCTLDRKRKRELLTQQIRRAPYTYWKTNIEMRMKSNYVALLTKYYGLAQLPSLARTECQLSRADLKKIKAGYGNYRKPAPIATEFPTAHSETSATAIAAAASAH